MARPRTPLTDEDEATLWALSLVERTTVAEQRRRAIRAYTRRARRDEHIATLVRIWLEQKQRREREKASNVVPLETWLRRRHG